MSRAAPPACCCATRRWPKPRRGPPATRRSCSPTNRSSWLPAARRRLRSSASGARAGASESWRWWRRRGDRGHRCCILAWRSSAEASSQKRIAEVNAQKAKNAQVVAEANAVEADRQKQKAEATPTGPGSVGPPGRAGAAAGSLCVEGAGRMPREPSRSSGRPRPPRRTWASMSKPRSKMCAARWRLNGCSRGRHWPRAATSRAAEAKFKAALALEPPPDTPVYVHVPAGRVHHGI